MRFTFKSNIKRHLASAHVENGSLHCPMKCGCVMDNQHSLQSHLNKCKIEFVKYRKSLQTASRQVKKEVLSPTPSSPSKITRNNNNFPPPPPLVRRPPPLTPAPRLSSSSVGHQYANNNIDMAGEEESTSGAKHQCHICLKSVSCKRNLDNHLLIHLDVKPVIN